MAKDGKNLGMAKHNNIRRYEVELVEWTGTIPVNEYTMMGRRVDVEFKGDQLDSVKRHLIAARRVCYLADGRPVATLSDLVRWVFGDRNTEVGE